MHAVLRSLGKAATRAPVAARRAIAYTTRSALQRISQRRYASSTTPYSTTQDPAEAEALQCLEKGTQKLEDGDVHAAKSLYQRSVEIKPTAGALFNLGVAAYHLREFDDAINAWKKSIDVQPSADAHTNLASAYIISANPRPDLALIHLRAAISLAPDDPEIMFNLAAVLEASGNLSEALEYYKKSHENGVEKAAVHIRNVSTKIFGQRLREVEDKDKGGAS
ncbi:TPR-like protein [Auricularia subglabra TFB-10046 SS5]|nr:TPR-like protein [Auricularia subglabra TFB-10046 SS5]